MSKLQRLWQAWKEDKLLGRVLRNSGYLFSGNLATTIMGFMVASLLGPGKYGALGIITTYATNVNRFLSFRMGEVIIRYAGEYLAHGERVKAAAVIKVAYLSEALVSLLAYSALALTAPYAANWLLKDASLSPLFVYYGLMLLANFITESGTAVLQLANAYRLQGAINVIQSFISLLYAIYVYFTGGGLVEVLTAYLIGKIVSGLGTALAAIILTPRVVGADWFSAPLSRVKDWKEMLRFSVSTNLSGSLNLFFRDSDVLWLGYLVDSTGAGIYKFAMAVINVILMPVTPLIQTTFPEIARDVARKQWHDLRRLLLRTSTMAFGWTIACALGLVILGPWLLSHISNGAYVPSLSAIFILLIGYGIANVFFWNRPLLLALGLQKYPLTTSTVFGVLKLGMMMTLVKPFGYLALAAITSFYLGGSILVNAAKGIQTVLTQQKHEGNTV